MKRTASHDTPQLGPEVGSTLAEGAALRNRSVLIVDDAEMVRRVSARMLSGTDVLMASGGDEACRLLEERGDEPVDCVLLDMRMPGLTFEEAFEGIRQIQPDLPVVACSGNGPDAVGKEFIETPGTGFLGKPFTRQELRDAIDRAISGPEARN